MESINGHDLREMLATGTRWLECNVRAIDALNVFPVPDGDTGTNMLLTMRSSLAEAVSCPQDSAALVAQALARGALMGARGNSGVILSQILRGLARGLEGKAQASSLDLAQALAQASEAAYRGVSQPVEGTILTVVREAAAAARAEGAPGILPVLERAVAAAREAVARTPFLLPVLRQAGVVDAGGQGLYVLLEGALRHLKGEGLPAEEAAPLLQPAWAGQGEAWKEAVPYGYCTEFLLAGEDLRPEAVRERLSDMGESVLVVGEQPLLRIHLHTQDPGRALSYATSLGTLSQVKVENMQEQHREFLLTHEGRPALPPEHLALVAVVAGEGLARVFLSLGAWATVPGGQTMNPSVQELLQAVESVASDRVILLPNNPNVIPAARQVPPLTSKRVEVVPSRSIPQGVAALLALNYEASFEDNVARMKEALARVRSGEVATAVRSMRLGGLRIKKGEGLGLLEGRPVVAAKTPALALARLLEMAAGEDGLVTIYYSSEQDRAELEEVLPPPPAGRGQGGSELELVPGGQPHYHYIVSVE